MFYVFDMIYVIIWCLLFYYNYFYYLIELSKKIEIISKLGVIEN